MFVKVLACFIKNNDRCGVTFCSLMQTRSKTANSKGRLYPAKPVSPKPKAKTKPRVQVKRRYPPKPAGERTKKLKVVEYSTGNKNEFVNNTKRLGKLNRNTEDARLYEAEKVKTPVSMSLAMAMEQQPEDAVGLLGWLRSLWPRAPTRPAPKRPAVVNTSEKSTVESESKNALRQQRRYMKLRGKAAINNRREMEQTKAREEKVGTEENKREGIMLLLPSMFAIPKTSTPTTPSERATEGETGERKAKAKAKGAMGTKKYQGIVGRRNWKRAIGKVQAVVRLDNILATRKKVDEQKREMGRQERSRTMMMMKNGNKQASPSDTGTGVVALRTNKRPECAVYKHWNQIYPSIFKVDFSSKVESLKKPIPGLKDVVTTMEVQFDVLQQGARGCDPVQLDEVSTLVRYTNTLPYRETLVPLEFPDYSENERKIKNKFIEASWVRINKDLNSGETYQIPYIAASSPIQKTLGNWWRMIWNQNIPVVVMLTKEIENGNEKAIRYWPVGGGNRSYEDYGDFRLILLNEELGGSGDWVKRTIRLVSKREKSAKPREVIQFQYLKWPDYGVPTTHNSIHEFMRVCHEDYQFDISLPMLVHCSAGIGRTGVFISIGRLVSMLQHLEDRNHLHDDSEINVFDVVFSTKLERAGAVQTLPQYQYIYDYIDWYMQMQDKNGKIKS